MNKGIGVISFNSKDIIKKILEKEEINRNNYSMVTLELIVPALSANQRPRKILDDIERSEDHWLIYTNIDKVSIIAEVYNDFYDYEGKKDDPIDIARHLALYNSIDISKDKHEGQRHISSRIKVYYRIMGLNSSFHLSRTIDQDTDVVVKL